MKQKTETALDDLFDDVKKDIFANFNCHKIGRIESFDTDNQTAEIKLIDKRVLDSELGEELKEYSLLLECPVFIPKGANGGFTYPIIVGDTCLVLFNDRDIDNWFEDGNIQKPNTNRTHNLSDGIAIVGIKNKLNKLTDFDNLKTTMNYQDTQINLDDKIELKNDVETLKDIIDKLIDIIINLKTVDPISGNLPIDGTTNSALSALLIRVGDLLK